MGGLPVKWSDFPLNSKKNLTKLILFQVNLEPIESIYFAERRKCFTWFSSMQKLRDLSVIINTIVLNINFVREIYPTNEYSKIYLAVHSSNLLPPFDSFTELEIGSISRILYSKIENKQNPAYSNCFRYEHDYKYGNFNMKSDCVIDCLIKTYELRPCTPYENIMQGEV